eukprot:COSAG05_NODE_22020_length_267_cov_1.529762_1_plen_37_part_10
MYAARVRYARAWQHSDCVATAAIAWQRGLAAPHGRSR